MSTAFAEVSMNKHIQSLEQKLEAVGSSSIDCLVIAHADTGMIRRLVDALESESTVVLPLNQNDWSDSLAEIVLWAAEQQINHVVVAGHSQAVAPAPQPQIFHRGRPAEPGTGGFQRVVAGARSMNNHSRASRQQFAALMRDLIDSESLKNADCDDTFRLAPLFYVAHSDSFLRFRFEDESFVPLTSGES